MSSRIRVMASAVAVAAGLLAVGVAVGHGRDSDGRQPASAPAIEGTGRAIIVNLTVDDRSVHRADQALTLAGAARRQGRTVTLFLNVDAPRLAEAGVASDAGLPGKPSLRAQLRSLLDAGVTVLVAKGCAGVCDVDLAGLIDGARPGTAGEIAAAAADGAAVFSY